jgi:hypothetical protein
MRVHRVRLAPGVLLDVVVAHVPAFVAGHHLVRPALAEKPRVIL